MPYHLQQFSRRSLTTLATECGFEKISIRTLTNSRWLHYQWLQLFGCPPCGVPAPFWDPKRSPLKLPRLPKRIGKVLYRAKVFHVVTRIADSLGHGDNYLCLLRKST